jgi:8-hydroxy-5-deazaflavin:NADPH oxidoreductase
MTQKQKISIVGAGKAGTALQAGLFRAGYDVRFANKQCVTDATSWCDVIVIAVPFREVPMVAAALADTADGKIVIDLTNALTANLELAVGYTTSGAEELQKLMPRARVVKAFNTVFAEHMRTGRAKEQKLSAFVAGDDARARAIVLELAEAIGFDPVDAGPLVNARSLEPMAFLNIQLGWALGYGSDIGFSFVH